MTRDEEEKLAGDELEKYLEQLGADDLAKLYEEATGYDCGCEGRKEWLNKKHKQLKDLWASISVWLTNFRL